MPEAPNNRFWPAAVMTASKHLAVPIGGSLRGRAKTQVLSVTGFQSASGLGSQSSQPPTDHVGMPKVSRPYPWRSTGPK